MTSKKEHKARGSIRVSCTHCGYKWTFKGKTIYATCPSCLRKTKVTEQ